MEKNDDFFVFISIKIISRLRKKHEQKKKLIQKKEKRAARRWKQENQSWKKNQKIKNQNWKKIKRTLKMKVIKQLKIKNKNFNKSIQNMNLTFNYDTNWQILVRQKISTFDQNLQKI